MGSSQEIKFQGPEEAKRRVKKKFNQVDRFKKIVKDININQDELKAIKVLKFTGKESEWDNWSEKFVALARTRGFAGILLGTEKAPRADKEINKKKADGSYEFTEAERKEKERLRQANGNAYINLKL